MPHYSTVLTIDRLRLAVHLGAGAGEREQLQPVELEIRLYFPYLAPGSEDDSTNGFVCYDVICSALMDHIAPREYRLIEYLTMDLYRVVRAQLDNQLGRQEAGSVKVWISLCKCSLPVPYMLGGARFAYSDLPAGSTVVEAY